MTRRPVARRAVAVLSLSRSGSSLLARMLHRVVGVDFGESVEHIPSNRNNPFGYYENAEILRLNEDVLAAAGASVFQPPPRDYYTEAGDALGPLVKRARTLLDRHAPEGAPFGFKDPRLSLTFPVWKAAEPGLATVIVFRDPGAAALSIVEQNGIETEHALALWFEYYSRIFHYTAGTPRYVTSFERLLAAPADVAAGLARFLGKRLRSASAASKLVESRLVRYTGRAEPVDVSPYVDPRTKVLYRYLRETVDAGDQPDFDFLGSMLVGLEQYESEAARRRDRSRAGDGDALEAERRTLASRLEAAEQQRIQLEERLGHDRALAEAERRALESRLEQCERQRADLGERAGRERAALEAERRELAERAEQSERARRAAEEQLRLDRSSHEEELRRERLSLAVAEDRLVATERDLAERTRRLETWRRRGEAVARELDALRRRPVVRAVDAWLGPWDGVTELEPAFLPLENESRPSNQGLAGYRLAPGPNLQRVTYLSYPMPGGATDAAGLWLAPVLDVPQREGWLGVAIASPDGTVVAESLLPLGEVDPGRPAALRFPTAATTLSTRHSLRVFQREAALPVRVLEWRRRSLLGRGEPRAFCALIRG